MNISTKVVGGAMQLIPPPYVLPKGVLRSFNLVNNIHWLWRVYRVGKRIQENSVCTTLAEKSIEYLFRDYKLFQITSQFVGGVKNIVDCIDGYVAVCIAFQKLQESLHGEYPVQGEISWQGNKEWVSPYKNWVKLNAQYVTSVVKKFFDFTTALFQLSMLTLDAIDAFYCSPSAKQEANEQFANNVKELTIRLSNESEILLNKIEANKEWANYILLEGRAGFDADSMISILRTLSMGAGTVKGITSSSIGNFMGDAVSRVVCSFAVTIGGSTLLGYVPNWMVPTMSPPSSPIKVINERYVSEVKITQRDKLPPFLSKMPESYEMAAALSQKKLKILRQVVEED